KRIVRRLTVIDIVVRMNRLLRSNRTPGKLYCAVGDHLVRVHVGLRAGTGLKYDQRELIVPSAVDNFLRGNYDQVDFFFGKLTQFAVGERRAFFQNTESADHRTAPPETLNTDAKVGAGPLRLRAPQMTGRDVNLS